MRSIVGSEDSARVLIPLNVKLLVSGRTHVPFEMSDLAWLSDGAQSSRIRAYRDSIEECTHQRKRYGLDILASRVVRVFCCSRRSEADFWKGCVKGYQALTVVRTLGEAQIVLLHRIQL